MSAGQLLHSDEDVVRAFEDGYRRFLFGSWWEAALYGFVSTTADALGLEGYVPAPRRHDPGSRVLYEAIESGELDYRVERVESWEPSRCGAPADRRGAFFLEGWRDDWRLTALVSSSGELLQWSSGSTEGPGAGRRTRLPRLDEAEATIAAAAGGPIEGAQYVLASGYPHCRSVPCVAARRGETLFLLEVGGRLFAFALDPRPEEEVLPPPPRRCLGAPCAGYPYVVRVADHWLAGELLGVAGR